MRHFIFLFFLVLSSASIAQEKTLPQDVLSNIKQRIDANRNPSIVVGIIDKDGPRYYSFGVTKENGKQVNEHSIYEIGSISKVFTATLLANSVLKGELSLDDPIEKFLPDSVNVPMYEGQHITLGNLSDHTSSLPRMPDNFQPADPANPYADYSVKQMYDFLSSYELLRPIGSQYEYSNLAVGLLGHILGLHAGKSYEELMIKTIAGPLDMNETKIELNGAMKKNLAIGHVMGTPVSNWDLPTLAGAGAIRSSIHDMLIFLAAEMGLTSTPLVKAMELTQQVRHDKANGNSLGLGWHIAPGSEHKIFWHNGGTGGYRTFIGFIKETGTGVAVFTNSDVGVDDIGFHLLDPERKLKDVEPSIAAYLKGVIEKEGTENLMEKYNSYVKINPEHESTSENEINSLGYYYLNQNKIEPALALFKVNVQVYPESANVYDSYGEALMKNGEKEAAIQNYKKSLELNPGNTNAIDMLAIMGVHMEMKELEVADNILETYVGTYELAPGFNLVITKKESQLWAQATGQAEYEIYPKSPTEYFYKVVDAQIVFNKNADGTVEGLTLHQAGRDIPGKKIK